MIQSSCTVPDREIPDGGWQVKQRSHEGKGMMYPYDRSKFAATRKMMRNHFVDKQKPIV